MEQVNFVSNPWGSFLEPRSPHHWEEQHLVATHVHIFLPSDLSLADSVMTTLDQDQDNEFLSSRILELNISTKILTFMVM